MKISVATPSVEDVISPLVSGLLTIRSRFDGALDEAAPLLWTARDTGFTSLGFVDKQYKLSAYYSCW